MDKEHLLQQELIDAPPFPYTQLVGHEWGHFPSSLPLGDHIGKGDLVFQRPDTDDYLVVETKHLRTDAGPTARTKRNASRRKVTEQAFRYGAIWRGCVGIPGTVTMATYSNQLLLQTDNGNDCNGIAPTRKMEYLGQVDYLTPKLLNCDHFNNLLTEQEMTILDQNRVRAPFMVIRIPAQQQQEANPTPESFQKYFEKDRLNDDMKPTTYLEEIANSVLNQSCFYEPFSPLFIIAPNSRKQVLWKLQSFLRQTKR